MSVSHLPIKKKIALKLSIGLLARLFSTDRFEEEVETIVSRLAGMAPLALCGLKANYVAAEKMEFADYVGLETERHLELFQTEDRVEAFSAFAEKRPGRFLGR